MCGKILPLSNAGRNESAFFPTVLLTAVLFLPGERIARRTTSAWPALVGVIAAVPAVVLALYYTKAFGESLWFYQLRSLPLIELTGAGIGFLAGWLQYQRQRSLRWKRRLSGFFIPFLTAICVSAPYLKQIFLRPDWSKFEDRWRENVCLQSSESSCGPASAATLLRCFGKQGTEVEMAREAFTSRRGTENWYLVRALRRRGLAADCVVKKPGVDQLLYPAIAGVKLKQADGAGHFIAVLGRSGENFIVGDPLNAREELAAAELEDRYVFTGFYLVCSQSSQ